MNIKIAYILLVHDKPEQLNLFLKQILDYGDAEIYIHVDKKNEKMVNEIIKDDRIKVYSIYEVKWGSIEMMKATIYLMSIVAINCSEYTHLYYGSGDDLLIKKGLYEHLEQNPDKLFMKIQGEVSPRNRISDRYRIRWSHRLMVRGNWHPYRFVRTMAHLLYRLGINVSRNNVPCKFEKIYRGSQWFIVPREVAEYLIAFLDDNPDYLDYWEHALGPDEFMLQSIVMNSNYANRVEPSLMYLYMSKNIVFGNHPRTITIRDVETIENTNTYCARKFNINDDEEIIKYYLMVTGR